MSFYTDLMWFLAGCYILAKEAPIGPWGRYVAGGLMIGFSIAHVAYRN